jgi:transposase
VIRRRYADWTVERIRREAASIGPATAALCELILERRPHPEQGFRACLGIVRLVRPFGADRLEAAATRAIEIGTLTYGSVRSILDNKLDRQAAQRPPTNGVPILHRRVCELSVPKRRMLAGLRRRRQYTGSFSKGPASTIPSAGSRK